MKLIALQIKTTPNFQENLDELKSLINSCEKILLF
jgi:omega-amidase